jgi:hypothetical protein
VRVGNVVTKLRPLAANIANLCHCLNSRILNRFGRRNPGRGRTPALQGRTPNLQYT